ncbi:MAG: hypothetical protein J0L57_09755 [Burkholderiales bacterium]|nr:hypothetical protein [Burkholderiales bacterium]
MDEVSFSAKLPKYTLSELQQLRLNCLAYERGDLASLVEMELRQRPKPRKPRVRSKAKSPVRVTFDGDVREWEHARDAYVWLLEKFIAAAPHVFDVDPHRASELAPGTRRNHFAERETELFYSSPHLALSSSNFARLSNGWVADVDVSNDRKLEILLRLSLICGLSYRSRWRFDETLRPQQDFPDFF